MSKVGDLDKADQNDILFRGTSSSGEPYEMTKEEFDRLVGYFRVLSKWERELKALNHLQSLAGVPASEG